MTPIILSFLSLSFFNRFQSPLSMRTTFFLLTILLVSIHLVSAGPGTHRYQEPHSNYGDEKKNKQ
jgi:hypothetical protein